jgi:L-lactate dehydrogenase
MLQNPACNEDILVELKKELLEAQMRDLGDATYGGGRAATKIRAGPY